MAWKYKMTVKQQPSTVQWKKKLKQANLWQKEYWNWIGNPGFPLWQLFKLFSESTLVTEYVVKFIFWTQMYSNVM